MSFEALIAKVQQAEDALEARERQAGADLRQLLASWKQLWSPGRVLLAGLGGGFVIGLVEPGKHAATGRNTLQMLSALAGLVASGSAQLAAGKAEDAADSAEQTAAVATTGELPPEPAIASRAAASPAATRAAPAAATPASVPPESAAIGAAPRPARADGTHPDTLRRSGHL